MGHSDRVPGIALHSRQGSIMIKEAISKIANSEETLTEAEAQAVAEEIMSGAATPSQIASFITALRIRGENVDHITGFVKVMRAKATPFPAAFSEPVLDTCGTGGDSSGTFNISTAAALVCAAAGVKVAKHGNRGVSSKCGSADVLDALGIRINIPPEISARCLKELNFCFLFAPVYHQAMKHAIGPRLEIGIRTIFNLVGPLSNPAGATCQVLGVYDRHLMELFAQTLARVGVQRAMIVHGAAGLDEISAASATLVMELCADGSIDEYTVQPSDFEMRPCELWDLLGGDAAVNARLICEIFSGSEGPRTNAVLMNAGAGLYISGKADSLMGGVALARETIHSGSPLQLIERLHEMTTPVA